ncbi:jg17626 [Pararge aegeria aegeria]|uniref:Jg17626 protein n=4 Tax=Pararge aegeria TaxID=116150 RepID=A0A8S4R2R7_9NEOP|nr:jg17626 [Pararge aegeria aegeria]
MEDVYTIKVKTKPDTRNLYPSERRYSASTVSGLAWVHIALASTSFLLACLALVNPNAEESVLLEKNETSTDNSTEVLQETTNNTYILILAPSLITFFALAAGIASIFASIRWYIDRNITWLFVMSTLSTLISFVSFTMVIVWLISTEDDISDFYKDKIPFKDIIIIKHSDIIERNNSHFVIPRNSTEVKEDVSKLFTKRVLSINILIAAFLELLWSILSVKISYKGMRSNYKDDNERRGNCISVVTTIKGNNTKKRPINGKFNPKPDLIDHYPSRKIKKIFLAQNDNGFYLKNQNNKNKPNTETSSEFYKERMLNFLNRCAEGVSNAEMRTPSVQSEAVLNPIPEVASVDINIHENVKQETKESNRVTPVSWGDTPEHTVYNQNTINFDKIFSFRKKPEVETEKVEETSENAQCTQ